jgi:D-glycero-alpha-D-manno-heptose-7-phosphate kinase
MIRARTPLRISFAGGGTDVSPYADEKGGCILNATINLYVYGTLYQNDEGSINIRSLDYDSVVQYTKSADLDFNGQMDLAKGVIKRFQALPFKKGGFDLFLHGDAPPGSGLGSSSTFVVTLIGLFKEWQGLSMTPYEIAELAFEIERGDVGIKGGRQDQYAATFGGFNFIEFLGKQVIVTPLKISHLWLNELEYNLLLCYTGEIRESQILIEKQIQNYTTHSDTTLHALDEIKQLALEMKKALLLGKINEMGELLHQEWQFKKATAPGISTPFIDELYDEARKAGAVGGKIAGAGGGGYMLLYCPFHKKHRVSMRLAEMGGQIVPFRFDGSGLQTWRVND